MNINTILILQLIIVISKVVQFDSVRTKMKKKPLMQRQYHVKLYVIKQNSKWMQCGGACIHPHWVLTSAYCLEDNRKAVPGNMVFVVFDKTSPKFSANHLRGKKCFLHPAFNKKTGDNDIGLLKCLRLNTYELGSLPFQFFDEAMTNEKCYFAGWGGSKTLDRIDVLLQGRCNNNTSTICAKALDGGSVYEGDLGSPLFCGYIIVGLASGKMFPDRWNKEYNIDKRYDNISAIKEFPVYVDDQIKAKQLIFMSIHIYYKYLTDMIIGEKLYYKNGGSSCTAFYSFLMAVLVKLFN